MRKIREAENKVQDDVNLTRIIYFNIDMCVCVHMMRK